MILGICGAAGSGKDAAAEVLLRYGGWVRIGLADPMKRFCQEVFGFSHEQVWGPSEARNAPDPRYLRRRTGEDGNRITHFDNHGKAVVEPIPVTDEYLTTRHALQQLGTQWGRACYRDVWVRYAMRIATRVLEEQCGYSCVTGLNPRVTFEERIEHVVIPDVRFRNELKAIRAAGGKVLKLERATAGLKGDAKYHASEQEMLGFKACDFDAVVVNDASLEELAARVLQAVASLEAGEAKAPRCATCPSKREAPCPRCT